jgi:hypothetical protein
MDENLSEKDINLIFDIQDLLFRNGFASKVHEIIKCQDGSREYFAIKMDNVKGYHTQPDKNWLDNFIEFCEKNKIYREVRSIKDDCVPKNCIKTNDGKINLIDIDQRWRMDTNKKNIIFMLDIDLKGEGGKRYSSERRKSYEYSIDSWRQWSNKNNCEMFVLNDLMYDNSEMGICWQRYYLFDILEVNNIDYDQILMVDADTIVHPDCPNFFEETNHEYSAVKTEGCHEWVFRSVWNYKAHIFKDMEMLKPWEYINAGFQIVNSKHKEFFKSITDFYWENKKNILHAQKEFSVGTDQTCINYLLKKHNIDVNVLPQCYNLQDLFKKNLLFTSGYSWWRDSLIYLFHSGYVYHFNAIPPDISEKRDSHYWMDRVYKELYKGIQK